jgi:hypothetical protein
VHRAITLMARIRTIKPEFPQSESMGRVSRDARLTFIELWTLADDEGRLRGNSRMLASLLFPYDEDAPKLIDRWLKELERENCIARYQAAGASYIQILNWLNHQKIDKPSSSKLPPFDESSRILANPREGSSEDQGSRIKDQGREGIKDQSVAQERDGPVERVFAHWRTEHSHQRAVLDPKRRKVIEQALKSYDEATLCASITGYKHSPHHMGQNERHTVYDDIGLLLRDTTRIEAGLRFARGPPRPMSVVERIQARMRNGNGDERVVSEQTGGTGLEQTGRLLR